MEEILGSKDADLMSREEAQNTPEFDRQTLLAGRTLHAEMREGVVGQGSIFRVYLPVVDTGPLEKPPTWPRSNSSRKGRKFVCYAPARAGRASTSRGGDGAR